MLYENLVYIQIADITVAETGNLTIDPGIVLQTALTIGDLSQIKIDNMREQHRHLIVDEAGAMVLQVDAFRGRARPVASAVPARITAQPASIAPVTASPRISVPHSIAKAGIGPVSRHLIPLMAAAVVVLFIVTYVPELTQVIFRLIIG